MRDVAGHAWWRTALVVCGVYAIIAAFFTGQVWLEYAYGGTPISGARALALSCAEWFLWAALTPGVVWLARRFRIGRGRVMRGLVVHVPISLVLTVGKLLGGFESRLDPAFFVRIHRSVIVNVDRIRDIQATFHGEYVVSLQNGRELPCSRTYSERLQRALGAP